MKTGHDTTMWTRDGRTLEEGSAVRRRFAAVPNWARAAGLVFLGLALTLSALRPKKDPFTVGQVFLLLGAGDLAAVRDAVARDPRTVRERDLDGNTPLHIAAADGWREAVELLLSSGADPNAPNHDGFTPLMSALNARRDQALIAQKLLAAGASPGATLPDGRNALHVASATPALDPRTVLLLARDPAAANATDAAGQTPLRSAEAHGHRLVASVLRGAAGRASSAGR